MQLYRWLLSGSVNARRVSTCKLERVGARWVMEVEVLSYQNPDSVAAGNWGNLFCCDEDLDDTDGECSNPCDVYMFFCLQNFPARDNLLYCTYGSYTTEVVGSGTNITFDVGPNLGQGVPNPLAFYGTDWLNDVSAHTYYNLLQASMQACTCIQHIQVDLVPAVG